MFSAVVQIICSLAFKVALFCLYLFASSMLLILLTEGNESFIYALNQPFKSLMFLYNYCKWVYNSIHEIELLSLLKLALALISPKIIYNILKLSLIEAIKRLKILMVSGFKSFVKLLKKISKDIKNMFNMLL